LTTYDFKTYEESMFFHNKWTRRYCFPYADADAGKKSVKSVKKSSSSSLSTSSTASSSSKSSSPSLGKIVYAKDNTYCTCYDCMSELYTLEEYSKLPGSKSLKTVLTEIKNSKYELKMAKFDKNIQALTIIDDELSKKKT